jgi:hypothetical protein
MTVQSASLRKRLRDIENIRKERKKERKKESKKEFSKMNATYS